MHSEYGRHLLPSGNLRDQRTNRFDDDALITETAAATVPIVTGKLHMHLFTGLVFFH